MCRYAFKNYKHHFVCFPCRKTFKQTLSEDYWREKGFHKNYQQYVIAPVDQIKTLPFTKKIKEILKAEQKRRIVCPQCHSPMADLGLDFKSPSKNNIKAWKILEGLYVVGRKFYSCGCNGPGFIPKSSNEYKNELREISKYYESRLKKKINSSDQSAIEEKEYWKEKYQVLQKHLKNIN